VLDSVDEGNGGNRGGYGNQFHSMQLKILLCFLFPKSNLASRQYTLVLELMHLSEIARRDGCGRFTHASTRSAGARYPHMMPSNHTLRSRSIRDQRGNCGPILATLRLYRILQLDVFDFFPCTLTSSHARIQGIIPSAPTLNVRSTRNEQGNRDPILVTLRLYRMLQLAVLDSCPFTLAPTRSAAVGIQDIVPSMPALLLRSTQNPR
jgi:hypothetical protein